MRNPNTSSSSSATGSVKAGTPTPCCSKVGLKRGPWTPEEDEILSRYVVREGEGRWRTLPKRAGLLRCGKSCRLRWMNYLRPSIKHGQIAPDEEDLILRLHRLLGNRWSLIAGRIPGRTDNEIKNYWNTHLSKKLISQGIDPRTHKPLNFEDPNPNPIPNLKFQIPAPPPAPHPNPNPNPNPFPPPAKETGGIGIDVPLCDDHNYFQGFNPDDMIALHGSDNSGEDGGILDCCHDDGFSSFLDSLINDDMFMQQEQLHLQQQQQDVSGRENDDNHDQLNLTTATGSGFGLFHDLQEHHT